MALDPSLERRLLLYGLAAGATMVVAPQADAKVHYTLSNAVVECCTTFSIDVDHDGVADFLLQDAYRTRVSSVSSHLSYYNILSMNGMQPSNKVGISSFVAAPLLKGQKIGSGASFTSRALIENSGDTRFRNVRNKYLGVRFVIGGEVHYGWIGFRRVFLYQVTLGGWAYETRPDTPIRAGDTGALESESIDLTEPTSLGMLANGHSATQNWRTRTQKPAH
ncbi:MAG TPA: hypothetical protein VH437_14235 [Terriglobales bacterium]